MRTVSSLLLFNRICQRVYRQILSDKHKHTPCQPHTDSGAERSTDKLRTLGEKQHTRPRRRSSEGETEDGDWLFNFSASLGNESSLRVCFGNHTHCLSGGSEASCQRQGNSMREETTAPRSFRLSPQGAVWIYPLLRVPTEHHSKCSLQAHRFASSGDCLVGVSLRASNE